MRRNKTQTQISDIRKKKCCQLVNKGRVISISIKQEQYYDTSLVKTGMKKQMNEWNA